jgi:hypothetical protein
MSEGRAWKGPTVLECDVPAAVAAPSAWPSIPAVPNAFQNPISDDETHLAFRMASLTRCQSFATLWMRGCAGAGTVFESEGVYH